MPTVSKEIADKVIAGNGYYPGDRIRVVKVVEYINMGGQRAYGIVYEHQIDAYTETAFVRQPKTIWEAK
jgi:hypothetical protein